MVSALGWGQGLENRREETEKKKQNRSDLVSGALSSHLIPSHRVSSHLFPSHQRPIERPGLFCAVLSCPPSAPFARETARSLSPLSFLASTISARAACVVRDRERGAEEARQDSGRGGPGRFWVGRMWSRWRRGVMRRGARDGMGA